MADDAETFVCDGCLVEQDAAEACDSDGGRFCPSCLALHVPPREAPAGVIKGRAE